MRKFISSRQTHVPLFGISYCRARVGPFLPLLTWNRLFITALEKFHKYRRLAPGFRYLPQPEVVNDKFLTYSAEL
ncbi:MULTISPECIES: hypothetical protein [Xanthomonas]|uniref:hypothetical protein n=1 Tax=Xanthomonas TaxID=338 RepID=UPI0011C3E61E|nr:MULTISPECIES: hypothetical protein [Xanthomonas]CAD1796344.1 hypothetical protein XSP_003615 [Xanthomonas sp. CPBF 426]CAG2096012.1 hypothetical protein XCY_003573 [Xanthomonas euroxanthea]